MAFKPIDSKRDEFRRYLETCGSIEALTKVFSKLLAEETEPDEPLEYIKKNLCVNLIQEHTFDQLNSKLKETKQRMEELKKLLEAKNEAVKRS